MRSMCTVTGLTDCMAISGEGHLLSAVVVCMCVNTHWEALRVGGGSKEVYLCVCVGGGSCCATSSR